MNNITIFFDKINNGLDNIGAKLEGKKIRFNANIVGAIIFIIFSSVFILLMPNQIKVTEASSINAQTFPKLLLQIILLSASFILIKEIVKLVMKKECEVIELDLLTEIRACLIFLMFLGYFFMLKPFGFIISSIIFGLAMTFYFRVRKWYYYLIVTFCAVIIGIAFKYLLHVRLP